MNSAALESSRGNRGPALLAAARKSFFERGYNGTTVEQVAKAAGLSKRSVYLYFKNKNDLFITVASEGISLLQQRLEQLDVEHSSVEELIHQTTGHYLDFAHDEPEYFRIIFRDTTAEMMQKVSTELRQRVATQELACLQVIARIVARGTQEGVIPEVDPVQTAVIFWGTVTGIILLSLGGSQTVVMRESREATIAMAVQMLFDGLSGQAKAGRTAPKLDRTRRREPRNSKEVGQ
jgi:AcrR family transcriptional regulator